MYKADALFHIKKKIILIQFSSPYVSCPDEVFNKDKISARVVFSSLLRLRTNEVYFLKGLKVYWISTRARVRDYVNTTTLPRDFEEQYKHYVIACWDFLSI